MKLKAVLKYLLFISVGIFLVWWSLQQIPDDKWDEFKTALQTAKYGLFFPVFIALILSHFIRALRWKILIESLGYSPSIANSFFAVMIGYLANLAVPRLGEVLKCTVLTRYEKVPFDKLVGTIVAERAFDIICLAILFFLSLLFQYDVVMAGSIKILQKTSLLQNGKFSAPAILGTLAIIALMGALCWWLFVKFKHTLVIQKIRRIIHGVWLGLISIKYVKRKTTFFVYTASIWGLYLISTYIGFHATEGSSNVGFAPAFSCLFFGSIGMIVSPGGIGAYALFLAKTLEENGVPYTLAYANGTLQWFAQFLIVVIVGFICMGLLPWYNKKQKKYETG